MLHPQRLKDFGRNHYLDTFINVLFSKPELEDTCQGPKEGDHHKTGIVNMSSAFVNGTFGGPVFEPIIVDGYISATPGPNLEKLDGGGYAITRKNNLYSNLFRCKNMIVGYYNLLKVKLNDQHFVDIQILITDRSTSKHRNFCMLRDWHQMCRTVGR